MPFNRRMSDGKPQSGINGNSTMIDLMSKVYLKHFRKGVLVVYLTVPWDGSLTPCQFVSSEPAV